MRQQMNTYMKISTLVVSSLAMVAGFSVVSAVQAEELHTFKRIQLSDQFWGEGANFGDLNKDGVNDLVSGPWWWEGPDFKKRHEFYPATTTFTLKLGPTTSVKVPGFEGALGVANKYSDNFFVWTPDLNRDGWNDELAAEAMEYLKRGKSKAPTDARILSAIAAFGQVATKFGIRQSDTAWD